MVSLRESKRKQIFPVKVQEGKLDIPPWLRDIQYLRFWEYSDSNAVVDSLLRVIDN